VGFAVVSSAEEMFLMEVEDEQAGEGDVNDHGGDCGVKSSQQQYFKSVSVPFRHADDRPRVQFVNFQLRSDDPFLTHAEKLGLVEDVQIVFAKT
jgi:hypothetical protein